MAAKRRSSVEPEVEAMTPEESQELSDSKEFESTLDEIRKRYGSTVIESDVRLCNVIPTGIFIMDLALMGGMPSARVNHIFGWESSGKTTLMMRVVSEAQKKYGNRGECVYIDAEGTFDPIWASKNGVDMKRLTIIRPDTGEMAGDIINALIETKGVEVIVVDSIPALVPTKQLAASIEDNHVALQSKLISKTFSNAKMKLLSESKREHKPTVFLINQYRNRIVLMGDPRTLVGGNALKYIVDTGIEMKNKEVMGTDNNKSPVVDYNEHSFVIKKCKTADGMKEGEFRVVRNPDNSRGIGYVDDASTLVTYAKKYGFIQGSGASGYKIPVVDEEHKFRVMDDMVEYLSDNRDAYRTLKIEVIKAHRRKFGYPELPPDGYLG